MTTYRLVVRDSGSSRCLRHHDQPSPPAMVSVRHRRRLLTLQRDVLDGQAPAARFNSKTMP